jgi:hypothetical protein
MRARLLCSRPRAGAPGEQRAQQAHRHCAWEPAPGRVARAQLRADRRVAAAPAKNVDRLSRLSAALLVCAPPAVIMPPRLLQRGR